MGTVDKGEGKAKVLKVELVMKNGRKRDSSCIHSIQDQCLGKRRVWRHGEKHLQIFKEYDGKQREES